MAKTFNKNSRGGRRGCLWLLLILLFIIASGFYFLTASVREAKQLEQTLIDRFGWTEKYTPSADGSIPAQRLEAFIRVREAVQPQCKAYQVILDNIIKIERLDTGEQVSPVNATSDEASDTGSLEFADIKSIFTAGSTMMDFSNTRNTALLAEDMGLGEYLNIYLTAYGEQLANTPGSAYAEMEEATISPRARNEFIQILSNQLAALEATTDEAAANGLIAELRLEIKALKDGSHVSPWPNGPNSGSRRSLAVYGAQLAGLYCEGIVRIELLQKNRGFSFDG